MIINRDNVILNMVAKKIEDLSKYKNAIYCL